MKISIVNWMHSDHPRIMEGEADEIEHFLRTSYPSFAEGVVEGDLYHLIQEIDRSTMISVQVLEGEVVPHPEHHPVEASEDDDPWIREGDYPE